MVNISFVGVAVLLIAALSTAAPQKDQKLGKIFIKAATSKVNGQDFPDKALEDSANEMKKKPGAFELAKDEAEADFLLVVVERKQSGAGVIQATLSVKAGAEWKPGAKLSGESGRSWSQAAEKVIKSAEDWVKASRK
jgi:hypothetical protein